MKIPLWLFVPMLLFGEIPPPPGQLVDVGGFKLHFHCSGSGSPVVILEAGFPGSSLDWTLVQPAAARFTRVCSYDRAGFGWSQAGKQPRSAAQIADDLNALLSKAAISAPYVLAAHSMGGLYARAFIRKYPASVAGLILVDATHEDQWDFEPMRYWQAKGDAPLRYKQPDVERPASAKALARDSAHRPVGGC